MNNFRSDLLINTHPTGFHKDTNGFNLRPKNLVSEMADNFKKISYNSLQVDDKNIWSKSCKTDDSKVKVHPIEIVYRRDTFDSYIDFKKESTDIRDNGTAYFEYLLENVQEAFTTDRSNREYDNSFLEFLGDGVISMLVAWDLVLTNENDPKNTDIDSKRIQMTSSKKLYSIGVNFRFTMYDKLVVPQNNLLKYFIFPLFKLGAFWEVKFFERSDKCANKMMNEIKGYTDKIPNNLKEYTEGFNSYAKSKEEEMDMPGMSNQDFDTFTSKCFQFFLKESISIDLSAEMRQTVSDYFIGVQAKFKHEHVASSVKAFMGAIFNCTGYNGSSKILKRFNLIQNIYFDWKNPKTTKGQELRKKIILKFENIKIEQDFDIDRCASEIEKKTGYKFIQPKILYVALTHKSKSANKNNTIVDDYNILEFLGDSIIKMFNCKRILKMKEKLISQKEDEFSDIQRLKFIRINAEKNDLFSLICINSGIYKMIRHDTNNKEAIQNYANFIEQIKSDVRARNEEEINEQITDSDSSNISEYPSEITKSFGTEFEVEDVLVYQIKMLADVIEAIVGAIMFDSGSIIETHNAWRQLFIPYLERFADNPPVPPKRAFNALCSKHTFLKHFKKGSLIKYTYSKEEVMHSFSFEVKDPVMKYEFECDNNVVFRRYYENSVKSKEKLFYKDLKEYTEKYMISEGEHLEQVVKNGPKEFIKWVTTTLLKDMSREFLQEFDDFASTYHN